MFSHLNLATYQRLLLIHHHKSTLLVSSLIFIIALDFKDPLIIFQNQYPPLIQFSLPKPTKFSHFDLYETLSMNLFQYQKVPSALKKRIGNHRNQYCKLQLITSKPHVFPASRSILLTDTSNFVLRLFYT